MTRFCSIAISDTRLYAFVGRDRSGPIHHEWPLTPMGRTDAEWPALVEALGAARAMAPDPSCPLTVVLLPPLVQVRRVDLPKLNAAALRIAVSRNAARYFPGVREPQIGNGMVLASSSPAPYLTAAAATRLVDAIVRAVQETGWTLATILPAHVVWATAALEKWPELRHQTSEVAVPLDTYHIVLTLEQGRLTAVRRLRPVEMQALHIAHTLPEPVRAAGVPVSSAAGPALLPERLYVQRAATRRQLMTRMLIGAAAALVLIAIGVFAYAQYTLRAVRQERAAIATKAAQAATATSQLAALTAPLGALGRVETGGVLWSQVIADLAEVLPQDASLTTIRGTGDSLMVAGTAVHGADVFERMEGAKLIAKVRSSSPIRRELGNGDTPVDHFELVARLPGAAPLYANQLSRRTRGGHSP